MDQVIFSSAMASILVNGSPTSEFPFFRGLKQGDPLAPFLFILVMESLHLSVSRAVNEGVFKGIKLHESLMISHLFYADDVMFLGEWSDTNLKSLTNILKCFFLASGLKINFHKSQLLGIGVPPETIKPRLHSLRPGVLSFERLAGCRRKVSTLLPVVRKELGTVRILIDKEASVASNMGSSCVLLISPVRRLISGRSERQQCSDYIPCCYNWLNSHLPL
ncbi:RNA-directed DNA polymerase, eukaryota [Tanacetum coccineum]